MAESAIYLHRIWGAATALLALLLLARRLKPLVE
jgi:hypothetical protein